MKITPNIFFPLLLLTVLGCAELTNPNGYPSGGNNYPSYGNSNYDNDYYRRRESERQEDERRELDRERDRLERDRRRLERERENLNNKPPPSQMNCPSGFSPSERKCSDKERKKGCKDMRLSNGMGCVKR
ncbi:MAG: hypothetical protein SGJ02_08415 [bacterium]|nr:hypothetical protein [bacterium]